MLKIEKDYFQDRTEDRCYYDKVEPGTMVMICQKNMQPLAESLEDLECIVVAEHLTSIPYHTMGQKVLGYDIITGLAKKGRVVYIVKNGCIETTEGLKPLIGTRYANKFSY